MTTHITATAATLGRHSAASRAGHVGGLRAAFARWQERSRIRFELEQMSSRELADLGLNPSDIGDVANGTYRRGE